MPIIYDLKRPLIEITMLGGFSVKIKDRVLTDETGRTKQLWILLEYLIANRLNDISQEKLIEILWDDEECDNPSNALKNLIYRLRNMLGALSNEENYDFIVFKRNVYSWNNELPCIIDTEELEKTSKSAKTSNLSDEERLKTYLRAIDLCKGDFLPKSSMNEWVISYGTYYKNIYIDCVRGAGKLLMASNKFEDVVQICEKAAAKEPYDESIHELIINAYLLAGNRQKAAAHYEFVSELFYENLGVKLSDNIRSLMRDVMKIISGIEKDLDVIKEDLRESDAVNSAYFCDYEIFKNIYRIEARMAERFGQSVFVALLTLEPAKQAKQQAVSNAMQILKAIILGRLRKSDIVSRYSNTQYVLMLPSLTFENGQMVLNRIVQKFNEECKNSSIRLGTKLNPLSPAA